MDADTEANAEEFIKTFYQGESTGHDYWHSIRVRNIALQTYSTERGPTGRRLLCVHFSMT